MLTIEGKTSVLYDVHFVSYVLVQFKSRSVEVLVLCPKIIFVVLKLELRFAAWNTSVYLLYLFEVAFL